MNQEIVPPTKYYYITTDDFGKVKIVIGTKKQFIDDYGNGHRHHRTDEQIFDFCKNKLRLKIYDESALSEKNIINYFDR